MSTGDGGGPLGAARLGRYQLLRKIAVGGMAEIYLARVSGLGGFEKNVVVKRILPQLAESDEFFAMFLDEARIAATLSHPNVVQIYDAAQEGNEFFIAMEYLDGADLHTVRRVLAEQGRDLPIQHAVFIVSSIASGLHYAHERVGLDGQPLAIVHRDVTPHNVFLTREGGVKLLDFGIAKASNRMSSTSFGTLKGKLAYMSPEQCRGEQVDRRADIYSLGVLLHELTTGRRLYRGSSEYQLLREIVEGDVTPPSEAIADYPSDLESIVMRALARDRRDRFPNAQAMEQELEKFARRHALVGSTLALADFLAPILDQAQEDAQARHRRRMSSAPPPRGSRLESESDWQPTVVGNPPRRHERPSPAPAPRQVLPTPLPERVRGVTPPPELLPEIAPEEVRRWPHRATRLLVALVFGLGVGAAAIHHRGHSAGEAPAAMKAAAARPSMGSLLVTSEPAGAAVWLGLGPSPALSVPVDPGQRHWIRVERDGYRPRTILVEPSRFRASDGVAEVAAELEPSGAEEESPLAEPTAAPIMRPEAKGRIRVSTRPPASAVWLLVGTTPTRIAPLPTGGRHELRVARDGHLPAFIVVAPERFGDRGEAREAAVLTPRRRR